MKYFPLHILIIGCVLMQACSSSKLPADDLSSFVRGKVDSLQIAQKLPGIFVGVLDVGKRTYYGAGLADPEKKMAFDSSTLFEIGSITKTFTAYVLEAVLNEKNINDSSSIISYLPDSVQTNKALESISFLRLLNHSSGLPRLPENMDLTVNPTNPYDDYSLEHLFSYLKTCKPEPDGKSNYSNLGVGLAGVLAQRISGKPYETLLQDYIFKPFNIQQHPDSTIASSQHKAQGFMSGNKSSYWLANALAPAGGLKCSSGELLTYLQNMAEPTENASQDIVAKLLSPTLEVTDKISVCRTWHTYEEKDKPIIYWHNGGTFGFSTFAGFIPHKNKAVVIVINEFNKGSISDKLGFAIMEKLAK